MVGPGARAHGSRGLCRRGFLGSRAQAIGRRRVCFLRSSLRPMPHMPPNSPGPRPRLAPRPIGPLSSINPIKPSQEVLSGGGNKRELGTNEPQRARAAASKLAYVSRSASATWMSRGVSGRGPFPLRSSSIRQWHPSTSFLNTEKNRSAARTAWRCRRTRKTKTATSSTTTPRGGAYFAA